MVLILVQFLLISMFSMAKDPKEGEDYVWIELGEENEEHGLTQFDFPNDGKTEVVKVGDPKKECRLSPGGVSHYMYFQIDDDFVCGGNHEAWIVMEYLDSDDEKEMECHYDSNGEGDVDGAYRGPSHGAFPALERGGTNKWLFHTWPITDGRFENRQNGSSDFRLRAYASPIWINRVWVSLIKPPDSFKPGPNESWPMAVEPMMKLAATWGAIKK